MFETIKLYLKWSLHYPQIKKIKVYDLDGTIINSLHRYKTGDNGLIDLDYWITNDTLENVFRDSFLTLKKWLDIDLKRADTFVIFATARACVAGDATYQFLDHHNIKPDMFVHREGRTDNRGGAALKIAAIKPLLKRKIFKNATIHIFEDNIKYLESMTNELGLYNHPIVGHFVPSLQGH